MPVIGLNIKNIEAKKEVDTFGAIKVNTNTDLKELKEQNLTGLNVTALSLTFQFRTFYVSEETQKNLAKIVIDGEILFLEKKHKEVLEHWKKEKALPEDINIQILNVILDKCSKKALLLSDDLQLPPPIALPFARKKQ